MKGHSPGAELQPGDICAQSGLYEVIHLDHRQPHRVIVSAKDIFPPCKHCGASVRFRLLMHSTSRPVHGKARAARKKSSGS
ncbi:MAG TPA: hypothetical protein VFR24_08605 [Candidatus Angelobacter sp.]|nr:hypothetical protein [Candidatus Angelobacter sp.]